MSVAANMPARNVKGNVQAQDKILYVANKLGLSSLKYMQATTRVIYDQKTTAATQHTLFEGAAARSFPLTNLGANGNQFQVDEALLVEKIGFFIPDAEDGQNYAGIGPGGYSIKFDLIIGNKTVMKDVVVENGGQQAFYNDGTASSSVIELEGVGILIPPQVEFKIVAKPMNFASRAQQSAALGCYLFGTGVLLNFNTSI
jgi:hypothetical protein